MLRSIGGVTLLRTAMELRGISCCEERDYDAGCNIYAQVFAAGGGGDFVGRTVAFPAPTDATNEMLRAFRPEVAALFTPFRQPTTLPSGRFPCLPST